MTSKTSVDRVRGSLGSQRLLAIFLTVVLVTSAGCSGFLGDSGGSDGAEVIDSVPAGVEGVIQFDSGIIDDQTTKDLMNGLAEMGEEQPGDSPGPDSYEEAIQQFEEETDLSIEDFHSATMFMTLEDAEQEQYAGMIVQTDWTWEEIQEASEEEIDGLEEDTYNGVTVYKSQEEMGEEAWIADFGEGTFAFGTPQVVQDTIDTREGDAEPFSGRLRDAYDRAEDGYMKGAFVIPEEEVNEAGKQAGFDAQFVPTPEIMTMTYYTDGGEMRFDTQLTMASQEEAEQFSQIAGATMDPPSNDQNPGQAGPFGALIEATSVEHDGDTVTITFGMTPDEILTLLEELDGMAGPGMGGGTFGSVGSPSVSIAG